MVAVSWVQFKDGLQHCSCDNFSSLTTLDTEQRENTKQTHTHKTHEYLITRSASGTCGSGFIPCRDHSWPFSTSLRVPSI